MSRSKVIVAVKKVQFISFLFLNVKTVAATFASLRLCPLTHSVLLKLHVRASYLTNVPYTDQIILGVVRFSLP